MEHSSPVRRDVAAPVGEKQLLLVAGDALNRERNARSSARRGSPRRLRSPASAEQWPNPRLPCFDGRRQRSGRAPEDLLVEIIDGHFSRDHRALSAVIRVKRRHVGQDTELDSDRSVRQRAPASPRAASQPQPLALNASDRPSQGFHRMPLLPKPGERMIPEKSVCGSESPARIDLEPTFRSSKSPRRPTIPRPFNLVGCVAGATGIYCGCCHRGTGPQQG